METARNRPCLAALRFVSSATHGVRNKIVFDRDRTSLRGNFFREYIELTPYTTNLLGTMQAIASSHRVFIDAHCS